MNHEQEDEFQPELMPVVESEHLTVEQVRELASALDPARVKKRDGRGGGKFEYLATHDVVRTANRIFGYGNWGHEIVVQERIGEVEVESTNGNRRGYHVAYRCVVLLTVKGCVPVSGSGYGDGVEYGAAAQLTASELALKESESDALKRAFKNWGDQFGLILYAKTDERREIESNKNEETAIRVNPTVPRPEGWVDLRERFAQVLGGIDSSEAEAVEWIQEAIQSKYGKGSTEMNGDERREAFIRLSAVLIGLEESGVDLAFDAAARATLTRAFALHFDGAALFGPPWRICPTDPDTLPSWEEYTADRDHADDQERQAEAAQADVDDPPLDAEGKEIPFGDPEPEPVAAEEKAAAEAEHDREQTADRTGDRI